jgi:hypothetical protein
LANKHGHQEQFFFPDWLLLNKSSPLNQKKELLLAAMFIGRMEPNEEAL